MKLETDAQLNILLCGRALHSVTHGQSKHSANVLLTLTGKPNPAQFLFFPVYIKFLKQKSDK